MDYIVEFNNAEYSLAPYTIAVADKIEKLESTTSKLLGLKEKVKNIYKFLEDVMSKEVVQQVIGTFDNVDPNAVYLLYFNVIKSYNKPITEYNNDNVRENLDTAGIKELTELINAFSKSNINFKEDTGVPFKVVK